jgi:hypothetical protein
LATLPGFNFSDTYANKTRAGLSHKTKISGQAGLSMRVCERAVLANGGRWEVVEEEPGY